MAKSRVNQFRHEGGGCTVCRHPQRGEIERAFCDWGSATRIAEGHGLSRDAVYRHATAFGLFEKRGANIRKALEHLIERADGVEVNAAAVVAAVQAYAKISAAGIWTDRFENVSADMFQRMSDEELEVYARDGALPDRLQAPATAAKTEKEEDNEKPN